MTCLRKSILECIRSVPRSSAFAIANCRIALLLRIEWSYGWLAETINNIVVDFLASSNFNYSLDIHVVSKADAIYAFPQECS